jgi:hypothetical protein
VTAPRKGRKVAQHVALASTVVNLERRIQRNTCGLGHWREPRDWSSEPFSHTVTTVCGLDGHQGGWQIYNSGVVVTLAVQPIAGPFTRGAPYVWCKAAHDHNGNSGVYPTAPLFGRFISQTSRGPKVLSGNGKSTVIGAEYVYCFRANGMIGCDADLYTRSEIPVPVPSSAERIDQPAAFETLQHAVQALDQLLINMGDITDMADELTDADKGTGDIAEDHRRQANREARAYRALQPILNAAIRESGQVGTELADYLKASPKLDRYLTRWLAG